MQRPAFWRRAAFALGLLVAISSLVAACGGGDGDGNDEDYVKAMCESGDVFEEAIGTALAAALTGDEDDAADAMASALGEWLDAIDDANPPADVKEAHDALVDSLRQAVDALESGDADPETAFDDIPEAPEPPEDVQERLRQVAADTPECDGQSFFD